MSKQKQRTQDEELKPLTRDSQIYNETIEKKVINNSRYSSTLTEIKFSNITLNYHWLSKWSNLSEKGVEENISLNRYESLFNKSPSERSNALHNTTTHIWTIRNSNMNIEFVVTITAEFKKPDGSTIIGSYDISISEYSHMDKLNKFINIDNNEVNINIIDEDVFEVEFSDYSDKTYTFERCNEMSESSSDIKLQQILSYSKSDKRWVETEIDKLKFKDEEIYVPVLLDDGTRILFSFNQDKTDNGLWELTERLGYEDPLMLEGETVYVSLNYTKTNNKAIKNNNVLWDITDEDLNSTYSKLRLIINGIITDIKEKL